MNLKTQLFTGACNEQQCLLWVNTHQCQSTQYAMNLKTQLFTGAGNEQQCLCVNTHQCQSTQYAMNLKTQLFTGACNEQQCPSRVNIHVSVGQPSIL